MSDAIGTLIDKVITLTLDVERLSKRLDAAVAMFNAPPKDERLEKLERMVIEMRGAPPPTKSVFVLPGAKS